MPYKNLKGPKFIQLFQPVLDSLAELDGSGSPAEVADLVAEKLQVGEEELSEQLKNGSSRFANQVAWARFYLVKADLVDASKRGIWSLTPLGQKTRLSHEEAYQVFKQIHSKWAGNKKKPSASKSDDEAVDETADSVDGDHREKLLATVVELHPAGFERLCQRLLRESGFSTVKVTGKSGDGGIDGHGVLQVNPFVSFRVLFQCKKYKDISVTSPQVRDFRGAMQGRADKGIIMTTGTFTSDARKEVSRDGVPPIELVDGEALIKLFEKLELGLIPKQAFDVDDGFFEEFRV